MKIHHYLNIFEHFSISFFEEENLLKIYISAGQVVNVFDQA
jgi:hypothetical protein